MSYLLLARCDIVIQLWGTMTKRWSSSLRCSSSSPWSPYWVCAFYGTALNGSQSRLRCLSVPTARTTDTHGGIVTDVTCRALKVNEWERKYLWSLVKHVQWNSWFPVYFAAKKSPTRDKSTGTWGAANVSSTSAAKCQANAACGTKKIHREAPRSFQPNQCTAHVVLHQTRWHCQPLQGAHGQQRRRPKGAQS